MLRPIYYDTETTGIKAGNDRIVEIAAYDPINDRSFLSFVNPQMSIPKEASQIHHIDDEMVKGAPLFKEIIPEFTSFLGQDFVLIAHNNDAFDIHFLRHEWKLAEVEFPSWKFLDSLKWARRYRPDLPRHSLQFLRELFGIPPNQAHRAMDDVKVLWKVFEILIDDLPLDKVYELLNRAPSSAMREMPFGKHQGKKIESIPKEYVQWLAKSGALEKPENAPLKEAFIKHALLSV